MSVIAANVAELQGLYGPYSFSEKLLQKIWLRGDFAREAAVLSDGRNVRILFAGKWNLLGGPDFLGARVSIGGGPEITGDVELHLHAGDWVAHGHAGDPAYDRVRLHVVLFPPKPGAVTRRADGGAIPVLALLPLLHHDLEEFAADEAVELLAQRPAGRIVEELGCRPTQELLALLQDHAKQRWELKVYFARQRLNRLGWEAACHHAALEILGFRYNRAPMLRLAGVFPLRIWAEGGVDVAEAWTLERDAWSVQGVRPANQPRTRLGQYARWAKARPSWPADLVRVAADGQALPLEKGTRAMRREHSLAVLRARIAAECVGGAVGGPRLDTLVCDGFLPLLAARVGADAAPAGRWFHWFTGDVPPLLSNALRDLAIFTPQRPACNGLAQGLLGWFLKREAAALAPLGRGA